MSILVSNLYKKVQSVPESYVLPERERPGDVAAPVGNNIPVVDLAQAGSLNREAIIQQIMKASKDLGVCQVINHGVSEELMDDTMSLFKQFFDMPAEDEAVYYSEDRNTNFWLYTSSFNYVKDQVNTWKDAVVHACNPLEDNIQSWPENPARYRDMVAAYSVEVSKLSMRILYSETQRK